MSRINIKEIDRTASIKSYIISFLLINILLFFPDKIYGQVEPDYEEISIFFNIQKLGGAEIPVIIKDEKAYLSITDFFTFLKIKNISSKNFDSISGFFINQKVPYLIDRIQNRIYYQNKIFEIQSGDLIRSETNLYLLSTYFGQIFGLNCVFSFRTLSMYITTQLELPAIRELREEQIRKNLNFLKGDLQIDSTYKRKYPLFNFSVADWAINSNQNIPLQIDNRFSLALGGIILGGESNILLNYNDKEKFDHKQQSFIWRYVENENRFLKQVNIGKVPTKTISSIYSPSVGIQLSNTPTTFRRSFGKYTLTDYTQSGWVVELYVNNVLVDYVRADASGFYKLDIPLVYGNSDVKLRFYGPWGEEHVQQKNINIPHVFLPKDEFEYSVNFGIVEDSSRSKFSRANLNYGIGNRITLGGGIEYLSSFVKNNSIPFLNTSIRLGSSVIFSGELAYGVKISSILSYRLPSNVFFEANYTLFNKEQKAIITNSIEERKISVSVPIRSKKFNSFTRLSVEQLILPRTKYTNSELILSGLLFGINTNLTTNALFFEKVDPYIYSNLSFGVRLPRKFVLTPQIVFGYSQNKFLSCKAELEKKIFGGFLTFSYESNFQSYQSSYQLGFRYDFPFAQTNFLVQKTNSNYSFAESFRGSLIYDSKTKNLEFANLPGMGRGGITFLPFFDSNNNEIFDNNEKKAYGLHIRINAGRIEKSEKDSLIRVYDLEAHTQYYCEFDEQSLDNIAFKIKNKTIKITCEPNYIKLIEVPIHVVGEVSGSVFKSNPIEPQGLGRIYVNIYNSNNDLIMRVITESDGYFSYLGLLPGNYTLKIDNEQLEKINMQAYPTTIPFEIASTIEGDYISELNFFLSSDNPK